MTRQETQKAILKELEKVWNEYPEQRFGQLLINLCVIPDSFGVWKTTDEDTLARIKQRINLK